MLWLHVSNELLRCDTLHAREVQYIRMICYCFCWSSFFLFPSDGSRHKQGGADKENQTKEAGAAAAGAGEGPGRDPPRKLLEFCERFMEFLIDLLCQLPTRFG